MRPKYRRNPGKPGVMADMDCGGNFKKKKKKGYGGDASGKKQIVNGEGREKMKKRGVRNIRERAGTV